MARRIDLLDRVLAERSFADFVRQAWVVLEPKTPFLGNWHIDLLAEHLEAVAAGEINRLIINVPPRSGKSLLATIFLPWLGLAAQSRRAVHVRQLQRGTLDQHSVDRRALIQSPWYQSRWSGVVKLADDSNLKTRVFQHRARPPDRDQRRRERDRTRWQLPAR